MKAPLALTVLIALASTPVGAQTTEWRPDLIAAYESDGGKNVPNFLFDGPGGTHSAGGVCQMLTHTWQRVAPSIDIDIIKFPVAGSAPEFMQWQACWKLWSVEGYAPWTCCNAKLRRVLQQGGPDPSPTERRASTVVPANEKLRSAAAGRVAAFNERLSASSDVYHAMPIDFH
jgi:hypothetical protein